MIEEQSRPDVDYEPSTRGPVVFRLMMEDPAVDVADVKDAESE